MVLREITIDNSVRYIPKGEQTRESKKNTIKNKSTPRKLNKKIHKTMKNSLIKFQHQDSNSLNE